MIHLRTLALAALTAALITGCGSKDKDTAPKTGAPAAAVSPARGTAPAISGAPAGESKIVSLPFRVDVSLSEDARKRLAETNADLGVSADYYGAPKDTGMAGLDPDLGVWLGGEMVTIDPGQRSVTFKGQVDAARVAREVIGDARVRVLVFPVRAFSAEAAITCTEFDEYMSIAVETGGTSHCTLKGE
ncbi:hypothetical protein [Hyphomonas sp.]|uniref:hypothetical protein n=1 Tax=Hyphomonas sp. TaxID=87 RepID=UPI0025BB400D|nr:hypothetical protein [Hyphomonas sp.]